MVLMSPIIGAESVSWLTSSGITLSKPTKENVTFQLTLSTTKAKKFQPVSEREILGSWFTATASLSLATARP